MISHKALMEKKNKQFQKENTVSELSTANTTRHLHKKEDIKRQKKGPGSIKLGTSGVKGTSILFHLT